MTDIHLQDVNIPYAGTRYSTTCKDGTPRLTGGFEYVFRGMQSETSQANAGEALVCCDSQPRLGTCWAVVHRVLSVAMVPVHRVNTM